MRTLALETTEKIGTIALLEGDSLVDSVAMPPDQRSAQALAAQLEQLLSSHSWEPRDVRLVAVTNKTGPGKRERHRGIIPGMSS